MAAEMRWTVFSSTVGWVEVDTRARWDAAAGLTGVAAATGGFAAAGGMVWAGAGPASKAAKTSVDGTSRIGIIEANPPLSASRWPPRTRRKPRPKDHNALSLKHLADFPKPQ